MESICLSYMSHEINPTEMLLRNAEQFPRAVHNALPALSRACVRRLVVRLDGGLSLSSMQEESPIVIKSQDEDSILVVSQILIWIVRYGHCNNG